MTERERATLRRLVDEARRQQTSAELPTCDYCGREFTPSRYKPSQRFCRNTCRTSYARGYTPRLTPA